jgi:AcrR family transcriptional regulator
MDPRQSREEAGRETKERILRTFTEMVADQGYHATAIGDLAQAAGISKGAVLHHFGTKDGLLVAAGVSYIERRDAELALAFERLENPIDQFAAVVYSTVMAERDDRAASRVFGREFPIFKSDPRLEDVRISRKRYVARVARMIVRCMDAGVLRRDDPTMVLLQIYGMCNWTWTWYRPDGPLTAEEIAGRFTRTLLGGLGSDLKVDEQVVDEAAIVATLREAQGAVIA